MSDENEGSPEPITIFSRLVDPGGVARRLQELVPTVKIMGPPDNWESATVTFQSGRDALQLTFTHDADYYAEPNWQKQMAGFRGFLSQFSESDAQQRAICLTTTFKFSLGTLFTPDMRPDGDPRLDILFEVATWLDGVLFTPSTIRDAEGRILFSYFGDDEDPEAEWPKVLGEVKLDRTAEADDDAPEEEAEPPSAERVARRALALTALTARGILEQEAGSEHAAGTWQRLQAWIAAIGIGDELEPDEWEVIQRPIGRLQGQMHVNACWRLEGLVVLAWALGKFEVPPHDGLVECNDLFPAMGLLDEDAARELLGAPTLRSAEELEEFRERQFALHWRLRNFGLKPEVMNFAEFAATCWFGPLNITGLPLIDGDLAIGGDRIDHADGNQFGTCQSAAMERHLAINWLCAGPEIYSEADVST